ncbi:MAG: hypothetical protein HN337_02700 [Deltaproteobacteria bacterium]|jgi:hypothetical protein|nr:hypothetical protein [Deltaproteobacteria bacterium]
MCGGIRFEIDGITEEEFLKFFLPDELAAFQRMGFVESLFWSRRPLLPVKTSIKAGAIHLLDWGNRDKDIDLPQTGWTKWESFEKGKWNHLNPKKILIPAIQGCEKKKWFDIDNPIAGIVVEKCGVKHAYMITEPASEEYEEFTGHERMPKFIGS